MSLASILYAQNSHRGLLHTFDKWENGVLKVLHYKPFVMNDRYFDMFNYQLLAQNQTAK